MNRSHASPLCTAPWRSAGVERGQRWPKLKSRRFVHHSWKFVKGVPLAYLEYTRRIRHLHVVVSSCIFRRLFPADTAASNIFRIGSNLISKSFKYSWLVLCTLLKITSYRAILMLFFWSSWRFMHLTRKFIEGVLLAYTECTIRQIRHLHVAVNVVQIFLMPQIPFKFATQCMGQPRNEIAILEGGGPCHMCAGPVQGVEFGRVQMPRQSPVECFEVRNICSRDKEDVVVWDPSKPLSDCPELRGGWEIFDGDDGALVSGPFQHRRDGIVVGDEVHVNVVGFGQQTNDSCMALPVVANVLVVRNAPPRPRYRRPSSIKISSHHTCACGFGG